MSTRLYSARLLFSVLLLVALVAVATPAVAQEAFPSIAILDSERVGTETAVGQRMQGRMEAALQSWRVGVSNAQTELETLQRQRERQAPTLSALALAQLDGQIEQKQIELDRLQEDGQRAMERLRNESMDDVNVVLRDALMALIAERGYSLVLDTRMAQAGLLYYDAAMEITDEFIAYVDAREPPTEPQQ